MPKTNVGRIVEHQSGSVLRKIADSQDEFEFLEGLVEKTKRPIPKTAHHYLIRTPFRYPLPILPQFAARFSPPFSNRHVSYHSFAMRTCFYEYAFHWLKQRVHVKGLSLSAQPRTYFEVRYSDSKAMDIRRHRDVKKIMNRDDYGASQAFMSQHPNLRSLIYPSCRDPERGASVAVFAIDVLGKKILKEHTLHLIYDESRQSCLIEDALGDPIQSRLREIAWAEVK